MARRSGEELCRRGRDDRRNSQAEPTRCGEVPRAQRYDVALFAAEQSAFKSYGLRRRRSSKEGAFGRSPRGLLDRKSTRLNSSHANISYAVFCLKKKTRTHQSSHARRNDQRDSARL